MHPSAVPGLRQATTSAEPFLLAVAGWTEQRQEWRHLQVREVPRSFAPSLLRSLGELGMVAG